MSLAQSSSLLMVCFFIAVIVLALTKSVYLPGRGIYLFRALFPSWRFFEDICELPVLYYRFGPEGQELGEWQPCFENSRRRLSAFVYNPEGNLRLACNGLLQQLESDIEELDPDKKDVFDQSVSYNLTKKMVLYQIAKAHGVRSGFQFQFRVGSVLQGGSVDTPEIYLTSPIHRV